MTPKLLILFILISVKSCGQVGDPELLEGNWRLDSAELSPLTIPSFCKDLKPGSVFSFNAEHELKIYPKDSSGFCNKYRFGVSNSKLEIVEHDMSIVYEIIKLSPNTLILNSTYIPTHKMSRESVKSIENGGYMIHLSRIE